MNVNNNKRGRMKKVVNWVTNRLDKWLKVKTINLFNVEAKDMKAVAIAVGLIAVAWMFDTAVDAYAIAKNEVRRDVTVTLVTVEKK